jgi:hypothetical protein
MSPTSREKKKSVCSCFSVPTWCTYGYGIFYFSVVSGPKLFYFSSLGKMIYEVLAMLRPFIRGFKMAVCLISPIPERKFSYFSRDTRK